VHAQAYCHTPIILITGFRHSFNALRVYDEISHIMSMDKLQWCMQKLQDDLNRDDYRLFQTHPTGHFSVQIMLRCSPIFAVDPPPESDWMPRYWSRFGRPKPDGTAIRYHLSAVHPDFLNLQGSAQLLTVRNMAVPEALVCQQLLAVEDYVTTAFANMVTPITITICAIVVQHFSSKPYRERGKDLTMNMEENTILVIGLTETHTATLLLWYIMGFHPIGLSNCPVDAGLLTVWIHQWRFICMKSILNFRQYPLLHHSFPYPEESTIRIGGIPLTADAHDILRQLAALPFSPLRTSVMRLWRDAIVQLTRLFGYAMIGHHRRTVRFKELLLR